MVWPFRRSLLVRRVLGTVKKISLVLLASVAVIGLLFAEAFGHPLAMAVLGFLFGAVPLAVLVGTVLVGRRAALAAGPGWIGVRVVRRWRTIDLDQVRSVRLIDGGGFPGGGFPGGGFPGRFPGSGQDAIGPRSLVIEDSGGNRVDVGLEALGSGFGEVLRQGLGPDAVIEAEAREVLGGPGPDPGAEPSS